MKRISIIVAVLLIGFLAVDYAGAGNPDKFSHVIKMGESVSLICIDYYGCYTPKMGEAIKGLNPSLEDINLIRTGATLVLRKPQTPSKTKTAKPSLFEKKVNITQGVITCVEGKALLIKKGSEKKAPLIVNTLVNPGDVLQTESNGRVEIIINRESVVRMKENTRLTFGEFREKKSGKDATNVKLKGGTLWTKVKKFSGKFCRFELTLPTAVAGVYGTVYQTSLDKDSTAEVKVYSGEVAVKNQPSKQGGTSPGDLGEVPGPHEVPGPREVTMEEWTQIIRTMQKITIGKDGVPSAVTSFKKVSSDTWEQWNEERDKRIAELYSEK